MIATALARAGMIGLLATVAAVPVSRFRSPFPWMLLFAGYLAPMLLVGYAYATFPFVSYPVLLWLKLTPLAALILRFAPSPVSASALHCHRLTRRGSSLAFWFASGAARPFTTAFTLVTLIAFQEFELASLLSVRTWTVQLFDAHAGGLPLSRSLRLAASPMLCELALLAVLLRQKPGVGCPESRQVFVPLAWAFVVATVAILLIVPAVIVLRGTMQGVRALLQNFALWRELAASMFFGVTAALLAYSVARRSIGLLLPALLGSLVLALAVLALFQLPGLNACRDTVIPLLLTLALWLLPNAFLLRLALDTVERSTPLHVARLLDDPRPLVWELNTRKQFAVVFVLFCCAYFELTASSILAPIGFTPAAVRLYNLMHYGQSAVLSAMLCVVVVVPVLSYAAARFIWRHHALAT